MIYGIAMFQTLMLVSLVVATTSAGVTPGDEDSICEQLRSVGVAPTPAYSANMRVLMDSWNYQNLLPPRIGAVWDQVDNDRNNPSGVTANVSHNNFMHDVGISRKHKLKHFYSGFSNQILRVNKLSKCVGSVLVHRITGSSHSSSTGR